MASFLQGDSLGGIAHKANNFTNDLFYLDQALENPPPSLPDGIYRQEAMGYQIQALQSILDSFGFSLLIDGIYGPETASVIRQLQQKFPPSKADGVYGPQTKASLQTLLDIHFHLVNNPTDSLVLVNKVNGLPAEYIPQDLVVPDIPFTFLEYDPKKQLRKDAATALEQLFRKSSQNNLSLMGVSGYRSYERQAQIYARNIQISPAKAQFSAPPGSSEHQTGLAIDLSAASNNYQLSQSFATTPEGQWLAQNVSEFGFLIRYQQGKEAITGYQAEPWHIRYVGIDNAQVITQQGLTLEEYLSKYSGI